MHIAVTDFHALLIVHPIPRPATEGTQRSLRQTVYVVGLPKGSCSVCASLCAVRQLQWWCSQHSQHRYSTA